MLFDKKGVYLFVERPNMGSVRFFFYRFKSGSFYSIQSPFTNNNFIEVIEARGDYFNADFSKIKAVHFKDYRFSTIKEAIKADENEIIFITFINEYILRKFNENEPVTYNGIFDDLNEIAKSNRKKLIINYILPENHDRRRSKMPNKLYLKKQGVDLDKFTKAYWLYRDSYYNHRAKFDFLEIFDMKNKEVFVF